MSWKSPFSHSSHIQNNYQVESHMNCPGKQPQSRDTRHIQKPLDVHTTKCNPNQDILTTIIGLNFPPLTLLSYPQEIAEWRATLLSNPQVVTLDTYIYINLETGRTSTFTPHHVISIGNRKIMPSTPSFLGRTAHSNTSTSFRICHMVQELVGKFL